MNINSNYKALLEGRMTKTEFLRQARQGLPQYITNFTSFDDAIKILRQRSIISEELVYQNKADKFPLESIQRGIVYELEAMGVEDTTRPSKEEYKKARQRTIDNLCKDSLYYIRKIEKGENVLRESIETPNFRKITPEQVAKFPVGTKLFFKDELSGTSVHIKKVGDNSWKDENGAVFTDEEVAEGLVHPDAHDHKIEEAAENSTQLNKQFFELYIKYKDGKYQIKDKETGETKPGKALAPETAAQKACLVVRKLTGNKNFRPDRNTIANCATGKGKLQYQGESNGIPKFNYAWSMKENNVEEAAWSEYSGNPVYTQFYQHYLKKAKEAKDPNAEKTARGQAKKAFLKYQEKHAIKEALKKSKAKREEMVLKESVIQLIGKILGEEKENLQEAATANLAQLSDENASVAELPAAINSLENIVTEIESFWLKEQQKIQGVFDSLGNIKNEDGLPIGYKFVQPVMESLKKDLEPVLAKISLEGLKLPEAPAPDQTPVNDPNAEADPNDPNAVPPVPEKKTVFSPAEKEPLQESKKRRYTK